MKLFLRVMSLLALAIAPPTARASNCAGTSTGMIPVNDLGPGFYKGVQGGLYPGGSNLRPATHEAAGVAIASASSDITRRNSFTGASDPGAGRTDRRRRTEF